MTHVTSQSGRRFATFPAAVLVCLVNAAEEILLLRHPQLDGWEVVNGAMEAGETIVEAALRETAEEAGPAVRVRPIGVAHAASWQIDESVGYMISVVFVMAYEGGEVTPGDDMAGSDVRWWRGEELKILVPSDGRFVLERALDVYRLWK